MIRLEGRRAHALAIAILALVPLVFFAEMIFEGKEPAAPDTQASRPLSVWGERTEEAIGEVPLWCPGIFSGMPSFGSFIYTPSSPFDLTRLLRQPFRASRGMRYYVTLLLGAGALYALLSIRRLAPPAALIGTLAFVMTPYAFGLVAAGHATKLQALYLAPLVFLAIEWLLARRSLLMTGLLAAAIAFQLWNNHPQISYYTLLLGGLYFLLVLAFDRPQGWTGRRLGVGVALAVLAIALGVGLVMDPYAAVMEYTPYSVRGATGGLEGEAETGAGWDYATAWSFPPEESISFLFPSWFGLEGELYWGRLPFTQSTHYFGITILILAIAGVVLGTGRRRWILLAISLFVLIVGFGRHLPLLYWPMYELLPYFSRFRVPSMIYALLPLFAGMLAAVGAQALLRAPAARVTGARARPDPIPGPREAKGAGKGKTARASREAGPAAGGRVWRWLLLALPIALLWFVLRSPIQQAFAGAGAFVKAGEAGRLAGSDLAALAAARAGLLWGTVALGLLFVGLMAALFEGRRRGLLSGPMAAAALVLLVTADLWIVDRKFYHPVERAAAESTLREDELVRFLKGAEPPFRIAPVTPREFSSNRFAAFGLESVGGYQPAKLRIYDDLISSRLLFHMPVLSMLNVQYLLSDQSLVEAGLPLVTTVTGADGRPAYVHRNPMMLPRAWFVSRVRSAPDSRALFAAMGDPSFDPEEVAWVYASEAGLLPDSLSRGEVLLMDTDGRLLPFEHDVREIRLPVRVAGPQAGMLVLSEIHYRPGWKAEIDGKEVPILRVNHVLRGLLVPPGEHDVRLRAVSRARSAGIAASRVSAALVILMIAAGAVLHRRERRRAREAPSP